VQSNDPKQVDQRGGAWRILAGPSGCSLPIACWNTTSVRWPGSSRRRREGSIEAGAPGQRGDLLAGLVVVPDEVVFMKASCSSTAGFVRSKTARALHRVCPTVRRTSKGSIPSSTK